MFFFDTPPMTFLNESLKGWHLNTSDGMAVLAMNLRTGHAAKKWSCEMKP